MKTTFKFDNSHDSFEKSNAKIPQLGRSFVSGGSQAIYS